MADTKVNLISKTGICSGNYKYWASKEECDKWFLAKSVAEFTNLSFTRPDQTTKSAYNAACVHIPRAYADCVDCDYISFNNDAEGGRQYHAQIIGREYVNEKSTRLYFAVDYVATFWDTIKIGKSFIERTHVSDDWNGNFTASNYLLAEPIPTEVFYRPEATLYNPFDDIGNIELTSVSNSTVKFNMITTVKADGTIDDPEINYQAGGSIAGYLNVGDKATIEELMKVYVTYSNQLVNRKDSILSYLNNIYVAPTVVCEDESDSPQTEQTTATFAEMFNLGAMYKPRHAKVYDYLRVRFTTLNGAAMFKPCDIKSGLRVTMLKTGSPNGCYTAIFENLSGGSMLTRLASPTWPSVSVSANQKSQSYEVNQNITSWWHDNIPYTREIDAYLNEKLGGLF